MHIAWLLAIVPFLVFGALAAPIVVAYFGMKAAQEAFPAAAAELGLRHEASILPDGLGTYRGEVNGRSIIVRPDAHGHILVPFKRPLDDRLIHISPDEMPLAAVEALAEFDFSNDTLSRRFKTRRARADLGDSLGSDEMLQAELLGLLQERAWKVRSVTIDRSGVSCTLKAGAPFYHYIPPEALAPLIAQLSQLADRIERHIAARRF